MPWWGFLLSGLVLWLVAWLSGRAYGRSEILSQLLVTRAAGSGFDPLSMGKQRRAADAEGSPTAR